MSHIIVPKKSFERYDPYYSNVAALLPLTGPNLHYGPFLDYAPNPSGWNFGFNSTGPKYTDTPKLFGFNTYLNNSTYCGRGSPFTHTGDIMQFGSSDFTLECHHYPPSTPGAGNYFPLITCDDTNSTRGIVFVQNGDNSGKYYFAVYIGVTAHIVNGSTVPSNSTFHHVAATRKGTSIYLFVDGVLQNTTTGVSGSINTVIYPVLIGGWWQGGGAGPFYTSTSGFANVRITAGVARYTATFTPPSAPYPTQ